MNAPFSWQRLEPLESNVLSEARDQIHQAIQWPSRAVRLHLKAADDDSHTNLSWDDELGGLVSRVIPSERGGLMLGLRFEDLRLVTAIEGRFDADFPLDGRTDAEAAAWTADRLRTVGLDPTGLDGRLPYVTPDHPIKQGVPYSLADGAGVSVLARWYGNAASLLEDVRTAYAELKPGPSEVRCWPHHFDIATLLRLETGDPETARAIGVGFAPGDNAIAEPYFYANPWPPLDPEGLPDLPAPGRWHSDGFVGAIARARHVLVLDDQGAGIRAYLDAAIAAGLQRLMG